jgi:Bax protein
MTKRFSLHIVSLIRFEHLLIFVLLLLPFQASASLQPSHESPQSFRPETTAGLQAFFQALEYDWEEIENGIPPFILEHIPADIGHTRSIQEKKQAFFMGLLPMVLLANKEIRDERQELLSILERNKARKLTEGDRERIKELSMHYGLRGRPLIDHRIRTQLLERVDTIPPDLALAQAANESAWGTSRFAQLGNNLFGEWTFKPGTGIVPAGRPPGKTYEVRKFSSLYESIRSYMNNLNSNSAYRLLRNIRHELRKAEKPLAGKDLAKGLLRYSQRGEEYIKEIQMMIRQNKLARFNDTFLRQPKTDAITTLNTSGGGLFSSRNRIIGHRAPR